MRLKQWLRDWWVELALLALSLLGAFLLVERMSIRVALSQGISRFASVLGDVLTRFARAIIPGSVSDIVGLLLVGGVLVLAVWRLRWRLKHSPRFTSRVCPRCGRSLMRVHRKYFDRVFSTIIVPVHRYKCSGDQCNWQGLRVDTGQHRHSAHSTSGASQREE